MDTKEHLKMLNTFIKALDLYVEHGIDVLTKENFNAWRKWVYYYLVGHYHEENPLILNFRETTRKMNVESLANARDFLDQLKQNYKD